MTTFFDLGGTLLALDGDEIASDSSGRVTVLPGVAARLARLAGSPVFVVTNQADMAQARFDSIRAQVTAAVGEVIVEFAVCTHVRDAGCLCRKPRPGLVLDLASRHGIDLAASTMVGDAQVDRELAQAAGIGTFIWAAEYFADGP